MHTLLASRPRRRVGMSMPKSKSLRYILASPGYDPGTIAVNVTCRMKRGFIDSMLVKRIAACTHLSSTFSEI